MEVDPRPWWCCVTHVTFHLFSAQCIVTYYYLINTFFFFRWTKNKKKNWSGDFSGSPLGRALCFHCRGHGLHPWSGDTLPFIMWIQVSDLCCVPPAWELPWANIAQMYLENWTWKQHDANYEKATVRKTFLIKWVKNYNLAKNFFMSLHNSNKLWELDHI